jgi:hypothetical protein
VVLTELENLIGQFAANLNWIWLIADETSSVVFDDFGSAVGILCSYLYCCCF